MQCTEDVAVAEETSELSSTMMQSPQSQQLSTPMLSSVTRSPQQNSALMLPAPGASAQPLTAAEADTVLTNTPPPVSKPADHLVPLDLQPFIRWSAVIMSVLLICGETDVLCLFNIFAVASAVRLMVAVI